MASGLGSNGRLAFRHGASDSRLPWDWNARSESARINGILNSFSSYSDACDNGFTEVLDRHFVFHGRLDQGLASHFVFSHALYHANQCFLTQPFLLRQRPLPYKANVPVDFLRTAMCKSRDHAIHLTIILHILQQRGCKPHPSFYRYIAVLAGTILRLDAINPYSPSQEEARVQWESCLQFLDHQQPVRWQSWPRPVSTNQISSSGSSAKSHYQNRAKP